jgi:hypothetical protein
VKVRRGERFSYKHIDDLTRDDCWARIEAERVTAMWLRGRIEGERIAAQLREFVELRKDEVRRISLSSFWCEIEERTTVGIGSALASVMVRLELTEPPKFGLWCPGWPSEPPNQPIYRSPPHLYPDNGPDIRGASSRLCALLSLPETASLF